MKSLPLIILALAGVAGVVLALAQSESPVSVEIRLWESVDDPRVNYISARPEGGSWRPFGTVHLPLDGGFSNDGRFRYRNITISVESNAERPEDCGPGPGRALAPAKVEVRIWEGVHEPAVNYMSARPEGGSWRPFGTVLLALRDGFSANGRYRYADFDVSVTAPDGWGQPVECEVPEPTMTPTATPSPTPTPTQTPTSTPTEAPTSTPARASTATAVSGTQSRSTLPSPTASPTAVAATEVPEETCETPPDLQASLDALVAEQARQRQELVAQQAAEMAELERAGGSPEEVASLQGSHAAALSAFDVNAAFDYIMASVRRCPA